MVLLVQIELFYTVYDERVLIVAHSWGDNVARSFLQWMEEIHPGWVDKHVAVHFNVAGPTLGLPKALTSLLSGVTTRLTCSHSRSQFALQHAHKKMYFYTGNEEFVALFLVS